MTLALLEWAGALVVLSAFGLVQLGRLSPESDRYFLVNVVGGLVLAGVGVPTQQWGFVVLNGAWAAIALQGLLARRRRA